MQNWMFVRIAGKEYAVLSGSHGISRSVTKLKPHFMFSKLEKLVNEANVGKADATLDFPGRKTGHMVFDGKDGFVFSETPSEKTWSVDCGIISESWITKGKHRVFTNSTEYGYPNDGVIVFAPDGTVECVLMPYVSTAFRSECGRKFFRK